MKGALVFNKYYSDGGMLYMKERLLSELSKRGIELIEPADYAFYGDCGFRSGDLSENKPDFILFFDKDVPLATYYERQGIRVINSSAAIEKCDDKERTLNSLQGTNLRIPKTVIAPLIYDVSSDGGEAFADYLIDTLGFPIVLKHQKGSQGRQVFKADTKDELVALYRENMRIPHMYQQFVGEGTGEDIRVYIVGKKAVAAVERRNTTDFRSNVSLGGTIREIALDDELKALSEKAAEKLGLEYGSVDFIDDYDAPYFIEANSSAYMKNAEAKGIPLAALLADYICKTVKK